MHDRHERCPLRDLFELVRSKAPTHARLASRELGRCSVRVTLDGRSSDIRADECGLEALQRSGQAPEAEIALTTATLLDLLDARTSLLSAVRSGELQIRCPRDQAYRLETSFRAIVIGAAHCADGAVLLRRLRAGWYPPGAEKGS